MNAIALHLALFRAVASKNLADVLRLLDAGAPTTLSIPDRKLVPHPPMHQAASNGFVEGMEALLAAGADVNLLSPTQTTPLMDAAIAGQVEAGRCLLRHGANARTLSRSQPGALFLALQQDRYGFAQMMLQEQPDLREDVLTSAAKRIVRYEHTATVARWLLHAGVSPNLTADDGMPWLVHVQSNPPGESEEVSRLLLMAGANVNLRDNEGKAALHHAIEFQPTTWIIELLNAGADPDLCDHSGKTVRQIIFDECDQSFIDDFNAWDATTRADRAIRGTSGLAGLKDL